MKIKMLKSTNCDGKRVSIGDTVDASPRDGRFLISLGYAVGYVAAAKPKAKKSPTNRMAEVSETRDAG